ncbi:MAG: Polyketide cyclase / dehydrase and lipid transport, partial [Frankiales bacterium]|nr:Polyketide cyclase / dehydrase and lipid transport [Frankiales bacterium]
MTASIVLRIDVDASPEEVFAGATDWAGQGEWMLGTEVWPVRQKGQGVGGAIAAWTGVGPLGFLDTMDIT